MTGILLDVGTLPIETDETPTANEAEKNNVVDVIGYQGGKLMKYMNFFFYFK